MWAVQGLAISSAQTVQNDRKCLLLPSSVMLDDNDDQKEEADTVAFP
jgi:hypothetical protein